MTPPETAQNAPKTDVGKHYLRVIVVWVVTLVALYAFQQYFS